jgi:hypothetical protein
MRRSEASVFRSTAASAPNDGLLSTPDLPVLVGPTTAGMSGQQSFVAALRDDVVTTKAVVWALLDWSPTREAKQQITHQSVI